MQIDCETIGMSQEELQQRVVEGICNKMLKELKYDTDDGSEYTVPSPFGKTVERAVQDSIDTKIAKIAEKYILPRISEMIETVTLQRTNQWGEKVGDKITFIEYITKQAEHYLTEKVNYEGKSKNESSFSSWSGTQTRIAHMIGQHLHYSIAQAMKDALKIADSAISTGIQETVKLKLAEISAALKVGVTVK
uniref:Uncharacterized protein n=1 Tax=viral metagenome TaxID=1070528 RepID=A0A6H1Z9Y1_9ZZZZ